jgi:centrosomal protein CEP41
MSIPRPIGDAKILERRLDRNPKYEEVDSVVDTGSNVNLVRRMKENEVSVKRNPNENFRRVRPANIARHISDLVFPVQRDDFMPPPPQPLRVLLVDVRDKEDYDACHLKTAVHYPPAMLNRSTNNLTPELLAFRNKDNAIIVVYDLEEEVVVGRKVANIFFERGFDNICILSGGLKEFVQDFVEFVDGIPPCPIIPRKKVEPRRLPSASANQLNVDVASTRATSVTSHKPKSLATSLARRGDAVQSWH